LKLFSKKAHLNPRLLALSDKSSDHPLLKVKSLHLLVFILGGKHSIQIPPPFYFSASAFSLVSQIKGLSELQGHQNK